MFNSSNLFSHTTNIDRYLIILPEIIYDPPQKQPTQNLEQHCNQQAKSKDYHIYIDIYIL